MFPISSRDIMYSKLSAHTATTLHPRLLTPTLQLILPYLTKFMNLIPLFTCSNQKIYHRSLFQLYTSVFAILESTPVLPSVERNSCDLHNMLQCDQKCAHFNIYNVLIRSVLRVLGLNDPCSGSAHLYKIIVQPGYHPRCVNIHQSVIIKMDIGTAFGAACRSQWFHSVHTAGDCVINSIVIGVKWVHLLVTL
jgi:hypothetical protein